MNIKKKLILFLLIFVITLSFDQVLIVQASTGDSVTTSDNNTNTVSTENQPSNLAPSPGIPESKPNLLKPIFEYNTQIIYNNGNSNTNITSTIGWKKENVYWYYYKSDNTRAIGWIKPDRNWYYLYSNGQMATGWLNSNGTWYYLDKSGAMATGWKQLNNIWYFFKESGAMITGLNIIDSKTYVFYSSGAMVKGWLQLSNYWYYFNNSGDMATGWIFDNGDWYYLYDTGAMAKGWINLNGIWYYLKASGAMATGWVNSGSDYYYLDLSTGRLRINTVAGGYEIGLDGKRLAAVSSKFKGIDISHYNGDINFTKVKDAGIQVVYIKATEGTTYIDNYLGTHYNGAKNAGLKTGFYHFLVGTSSPETQARNFYNNIKDKQSDLKPVLDVEKGGFDVMNYTLRFIAEFKKLSNMDVSIYTYSDFIRNLDSRLANYSLWEANYYKSTASIPANNVWNSRVGHQYTDKGIVDGIYGNVDLNEFTQDIFR